MAYHADDTFLPSWGSGMRPREPVDPNEEFPTGFEDYPPKPKILRTPQGTETQMDHLTEINHTAPYGTMPAMAAPVTEKVFPKLRRLDRVRVAEKSVFLLWWPAFLGACIVGAFGLGYWHHRTFAHGVFLVTLMIGFVMIAIGHHGGWSGRASPTFMTINGWSIVLLSLVSVFLGVYCFETYTKPYEIYRASQSYIGVAPSANPGAHRDAGTIEFVAGSRVASEHSIGIRNGDYYCVAPIVDPDGHSYSGFWAAGVNCCGARGAFHCGDVSNPQVRSGLVVLDESYFSMDEIPEYTKAAEEASAQFTIGMPTKPIFVRWSSDTDADRDQYFRGATSFLLSATAGLFGFMLVFVMALSVLPTAHEFYAVDVYDLGGTGAPRRGKKSKRASQAFRNSDPFLNQL